LNTKAQDCSGNGNTGTITGATKAQGKIGQGLSFDGNDDVNVGDINIVDGASQLTISGWIYHSTLANSKSIISKYAAADDSWVFYAGAAVEGSNNVCIFIDAATDHRGCSATGAHQAGRWEYWSVVFDGTQTGDANRLKMYLNGVQQDMTYVNSVPATLDSNANVIRLGADSDLDGCCYWSGFLDDMRIYSRALSAGEIRNLYQETQSRANSSDTDSLKHGLVGCWTFDGSYTKVPDCSGNNRTGTITGAIKTGGNVGQALRFDGINDNVNVGDINATDGSSYLTVSVWLKQNTFADSKTIITKWTGAADHFDMATRSNQGACNGDSDIRFLLDSSNYGCAVDSHTAGIWEHWVFVFDGTQADNQTRLKGYLNGVQRTLSYFGTIQATTNSNGDAVAIGDDLSGTLGWNGLIDEVRVYNRALSVGEIQQLYRMGR
jgi:hypothetical protein